MKLRVSGEGPLVVKVAGVAGGVELYREEMDAAIAAGFRVAALDTGGDRHDDPAPGPLTWDFLAGEVLRALDALGAERAILWGTSFGCLVSLAAATRGPGRVVGLLLSVPPEPGWLPWLHGRILRAVLGLRDPVKGTKRLLRASMILLCGWEFLAPPAVRRLPALVRANLEAATPAATYHEKLLLLEEPPRLPSASAGLPVSILAGAWDLLAPSQGARRLARQLPDSRIHVFGFSGHCVAWSRPATYCRLAIEELKRLARSRGLSET